MNLFKHLFQKSPVVVLSLLIVLAACSSEDDTSGGLSPEANSINGYINNLFYDANAMLNVQETGGLASQRTITFQTDSIVPPDQGTIVECQVKDYDLDSNFDDVAILRPTAGIVYPGALVVGNQGLLDGAPDPFAISRGAASLRIDLPGMGENGNLVVDNPGANTQVQAAIDESLEWWNDNAYQEGYVNAANSSYQASESYSSSQLSLDIGLNAEWATGSVASQFNFESNSEQRVAAMSFKQVFYTITMDTPQSPAAVFGPDVTLDQIQNIMTADTPPAYVASVSYGRIIMVRLETTNMDSSINLDAVLEYSSGLNSGTGDINATYDEVLQTSSINIVTIGGNGEVATSAVDAANIDDGPGGLNYIITGENALYSRENPGVPIAYTIRYLKDNSLAKMGYTTDYRVEQCGSFPYAHESAKVFNDSFHDIRYRFNYKGQDSNFNYSGPWYTVNQDEQITRTPPSGAHDVEIETQWQCGAGSWNAMEDFPIGYLSSDRCYTSTGGSIICGASSITQVSCN